MGLTRLTVARWETGAEPISPQSERPIPASRAASDAGPLKLPGVPTYLLVSTFRV